MATEKGWFIKSKDPNDLYFTLRTEIDGTWTTNLDMALLFARKVDAESYYGIHPLRTNDALVAWTNALNVAHNDAEREGEQNAAAADEEPERPGEICAENPADI